VDRSSPCAFEHPSTVADLRTVGPRRASADRFAMDRAAIRCHRAARGAAGPRWLPSGAVHDRLRLRGGPTRWACEVRLRVVRGTAGPLTWGNGVLGRWWQRTGSSRATVAVARPGTRSPSVPQGVLGGDVVRRPAVGRSRSAGAAESPTRQPTPTGLVAGTSAGHNRSSSVPVRLDRKRDHQESATCETTPDAPERFAPAWRPRTARRSIAIAIAIAVAVAVAVAAHWTAGSRL
jgi:hypothetical protein